MAEKTPANVHLERMEEAKHKSTEPAQVGDTGVAGIPMGKHTTGLLAHCRKRGIESLCNKQKAHTGRVL